VTCVSVQRGPTWRAPGTACPCATARHPQRSEVSTPGRTEVSYRRIPEAQTVGWRPESAELHPPHSTEVSYRRIPEAQTVGWRPRSSKAVPASAIASTIGRPRSATDRLAAVNPAVGALGHQRPCRPAPSPAPLADRGLLPTVWPLSIRRLAAPVLARRQCAQAADAERSSRTRRMRERKPSAASCLLTLM